jgi:hypothetical protein
VFQLYVLIVNLEELKYELTNSNLIAGSFCFEIILKCPFKAYSGAVNRLKSLWDNAILGDFRRFKEKLGLSSTAV